MSILIGNQYSRGGVRVMASVKDLLDEATVDLAAGRASELADALAAARIHRIRNVLAAVLSELGA